MHHYPLWKVAVTLFQHRITCWEAWQLAHQLFSWRGEVNNRLVLETDNFFLYYPLKSNFGKNIKNLMMLSSRPSQTFSSLKCRANIKDDEIIRAVDVMKLWRASWAPTHRAPNKSSLKSPQSEIIDPRTQFNYTTGNRLLWNKNRKKF